MDNMKLCESDYRFMLVVWEYEPVASGRLVTLCAERLGWKKPTTYTVLRKMCEKGLLKNEDTIVSAIVSMERVQAFQSKHFVERAFEGSLPRFLVSFLGGKTISEKEADELRRLIDTHKEGQ
jgi:BlaI family transcriptional regulator, penicillinase repressor